MRRLVASLLAASLMVATLAVAWASTGSHPSSSTPVATTVVEAPHAAHMPVHGAHPEGVSPEDCATMALGCVGITAVLAAQVEIRGLRLIREASARRNTRRPGLDPDTPERPPRS